MTVRSIIIHPALSCLLSVHDLDRRYAIFINKLLELKESKYYWSQNYISNTGLYCPLSVRGYYVSETKTSKFYLTLP